MHYFDAWLCGESRGQDVHSLLTLSLPLKVVLGIRDPL